MPQPDYTPEFVAYDVMKHYTPENHFLCEVLGQLDDDGKDSAGDAMERNRAAGLGPGLHVSIIVEGEQVSSAKFIKDLYELMNRTMESLLQERVEKALLGFDAAEKAQEVRRHLENAEWAAEQLARDLIRKVER